MNDLYRTIATEFYAYLHTIMHKNVSPLIKIKQKNLEMCIDIDLFLCMLEGCGHCAFLSRITIPRQVQVNLFTTLQHRKAAVPSQTWSIAKPQKYRLPLGIPSYSWKGLLNYICDLILENRPVVTNGISRNTYLF